MSQARATIEHVQVEAYRFPTETPEADGTLEWDATTAVAVGITADGVTGLGWTYSGTGAVGVVREKLAPAVAGSDAFDVSARWQSMHRACRNLGTRGLVMQAISAVDIALWDLKARLLRRPLTDLLGRCRDAVAIYGSGGFTNLRDDQLCDQVELWRSAGCRLMKIKIAESCGTRPDRDIERVTKLRTMAGDDIALMVDANGGYTRAQARRIGSVLDELDVVWFEEPVSSDDTEGLAVVRDAVSCDVAAGEYSSDVYDTARLCPAVDCIQLDVTRCGGYTGWLRAAAVAQAHGLDVSAHCAPSLHVPVAAAVPNFRHLEWFVDHVRLEPLLVSGLPATVDGRLDATSGEIGHGMLLHESVVAYRIEV